MAKKKTKKDTALAEMIAAATPKALSRLILHLAENYPEIRRQCTVPFVFQGRPGM